MFGNDTLVVVKGHFFADMAQVIHCFFKGSSLDHEKCGVAGSQGVESDVFSSGGLAGDAEVALKGRRCKYVGAFPREELWIACVTKCCDMVMNVTDKFVGKGNDTPAPAGFGGTELQWPGIGRPAVDGVMDVEGLGVEINVIFLQGAYFPYSQASGESCEIDTEPIIVRHCIVKGMQFAFGDGLDCGSV